MEDLFNFVVGSVLAFALAIVMMCAAAASVLAVVNMFQQGVTTCASR